MSYTNKQFMNDKLPLLIIIVVIASVITSVVTFNAVNKAVTEDSSIEEPAAPPAQPAPAAPAAPAAPSTDEASVQLSIVEPEE